MVEMGGEGAKRRNLTADAKAGGPRPPKSLCYQSRHQTLSEEPQGNTITLPRASTGVLLRERASDTPSRLVGGGGGGGDGGDRGGGVVLEELGWGH